MLFPRAALPALDERIGEPDFCLANSDWVECALLKAPLARPLDCIEALRVSNDESSLSDLKSCCTSVSSELPGVKPAPAKNVSVQLVDTVIMPP